jgi:putative glutamine amidotransferase
MTPLIAITCSRMIGGAWSAYSPGHFMDFAFDEYSRAVGHYGGAPVQLPIAQTDATLATILERIDGVILSGGPDIHPRHYGEAPRKNLGEIDADCDRMELAVARQAHARDLPILAICRGIQTLNVGLGGTLYQDIASQVEGSIEHRQRADKSVNTHQVSIAAGSRLAAILGRKRIWVNGKHHQAVKDPAPGLVVSATAPDGVVEAVEDPSKTFVLGVQWHPEGTWRIDRHAGRLFKAFLEAARGG